MILTGVQPIIAAAMHFSVDGIVQGAMTSAVVVLTVCGLAGAMQIFRRISGL